MGYKLYGTDGAEIVHHDLQDKLVWCKSGEKTEVTFVRLYGQQLGVIVNPEKKTNAFGPDLAHINSKIPGDLKTQNTPFFTSPRYGIDPRYAVVFNLKDQLRYREHYPDIMIYFWVDWVVVRFANERSDVKIEPLSGVWAIPFVVLDELCGRSVLHEYIQRRNDHSGNARSSYVLDITNPLFRKVV